jgi:hypothetical protein
MSKLFQSLFILLFLIHSYTYAIPPELRTADMPDSWLIMYNDACPDSIIWAAWYCQVWSIPNENTLAVHFPNCSERILLTDFVNGIYNPIKNYLNDNPKISEKIMGIIVGYHVPGNYYYVLNGTTYPTLDGGGGYSVASSLSYLGDPVPSEGCSTCWWIGAPYSPVPFYTSVCSPNAPLPVRTNKAILPANVYLTARLDGPDLSSVGALTDKAFDVTQYLQTFSNTESILFDYDDVGHAPSNGIWTDLRLSSSMPCPSTPYCCDITHSQPWEWPWLYYDSEIGTSINCAFQFSWYRITGWNTVNWGGNPPGRRLLGYALNSWGATTIRSTTNHGGRYVPNALFAGNFIAAIGSTAEPYYGNQPYVSTLLWCLKEKWCLGEAFFASNPRHRWMWELDGDPLAKVRIWWGEKSLTPAVYQFFAEEKELQ